MDKATQARLLSALESGSYRRVGGSEPVQVDVRIIAATHHELEEDVRAGRFSEDLFYHLNVVPLHVPPLREHREDVVELLNFFIDQFVTQENLPYRNFTVATQNRLRNHTWSGNTRELKNLVQRLLIIGGEPDVSLDEVEAALGGFAGKGVGGIPTVFDMPLREAREQFERAYLEHQLQEVGGSVGKVAKLAGMERTHLYRKLRALGIDPKKVSGTQ